MKRSARLRDFLSWICEETLAGRPDHISEAQIGVHVFGRGPDYDPSADNVVRVQARVLRHKLEEYFRGEGADEPLLLDIPKGGYIPRFRSRGEAASDDATGAVQRQSEARWLIAVVTLAAVAVFSSAGLVWQWLDGRRTEVSLAPPGTISSLVFRDGERTLVVAADSSLVAFQMYVGRRVTLDQYAAKQHTGGDFEACEGDMARRFCFFLSTRQYTSIADLAVCARLLRANPLRMEDVLIRHASSIDVRDLKTGNAVLLGSTYSNPWVGLFTPRLNFQVGESSLSKMAAKGTDCSVP